MKTTPKLLTVLSAASLKWLSTDGNKPRQQTRVRTPGAKKLRRAGGKAQAAKARRAMQLRYRSQKRKGTKK